ncbi:chromate efflux transporter [Flaviaesturariibacter amylovorans]|uniref:Chromate efflux transporter n=1 Tax=Flaviaesturariibacter amylovorans TaxID=1084520 RepID=A0ABP8G4W2_9BACT
MSSRNERINELARLFGRLGIIAFGGPAAHIALMRAEVVRRRGWIDDTRFLDLVGATNLIPGPNSTELAMHLGQERAGWRGLIVAGCCFILPAVVLTAGIAWAYRRYGALPAVQPFLYGIKPAIIAIILAAVFPLAKASFKSAGHALLGGVALLAALLGTPELAVLFGAGLLGLAAALARRAGTVHQGIGFFLLQALPPSAATVGSTSLFFTFLKIGALLYGSGYVLFAFLDEALVTTGMLTRTQLADAIAVGQFTPGPVFSAVTFVGYQVGGWSGAAAATAGVFLPAFLFVALLNPLVKRLRTSKPFAAFLDAVNVASVALIAAVCIDMGRAALTDWRTFLIAIAAAIVTFGFRKINSAWVVLGGTLAGWLLAQV